ncbi:MAG TPA: lysylphosphatidylglycerol synthase transmembrane domain-containing protein [Anaerolineae bacterium]|nr:lysylphosphatidylglycerol synthase transmembrane domain-containing protein [Anaerolineae bacterium]
MSRSALLINRFIRLAGPLLFLLILSRIDLGRTAEMLRTVRAQFLLAAAILYPLLILLKSWRWHLLLRQQGVSYSLVPAFAVYNSALAAGYVTPGRLGELVKALYLRKDKGIALGYAFSSVVMDRLLDLYVLLATAAAGATLFALPRSFVHLSLAVLAAAGLAPLVVLIPSVSRRLTALVTKGASRLADARHKEELAQGLSGFQRGMEEMVTARLLWALAWTVVAYALYYLQCYLIALALGLPVSCPYSAYSVSLASLVALLPVSISGLGVREAIFVALFRPMGLAPEMAVSYSLLILLVFNVFGGALGALAWLLKPLEQ